MTTITQAINGTLTLITVGREIYEAVTELMDSVDKSEASGMILTTDKLNISYPRSFIKQLRDLTCFACS